jgi:hypothetical protein
MKIEMYMVEPRLRAFPGHGVQGFFELFVTDPPRVRPFGAAAIIENGGVFKKISCHSRIVQFNMEMPLVFLFCVPVATGIVFVFMGNPLRVFLR